MQSPWQLAISCSLTHLLLRKRFTWQILNVCSLHGGGQSGSSTIQRSQVIDLETPPQLDGAADELVTTQVMFGTIPTYYSHHFAFELGEAFSDEWRRG